MEGYVWGRVLVPDGDETALSPTYGTAFCSPCLLSANKEKSAAHSLKHTHKCNTSTREGWGGWGVKAQCPFLE